MGWAPKPLRKTFVLAAQFDVFDAHAPRQNVVGEVEDVIAFMIGQVDFEQLQVLIDLFHQAQALDHRVDGSQTALAVGGGLFAQLGVDIAAPHHGFGLFPPVAWSQWSQSPLNSALAVAKDFGVLSTHLKCCFHEDATWQVSSRRR
jgi:hypothetical protein